MKKIVFLFSLLITTLISNSQTFNLTISNGTGSGTYNKGDTIHVWSDACFGDSVFTKWTGNGKGFLKYEDEWHTVLVVPITATSITSINLFANYDTISKASVFGSDSLLLFARDSFSPGIFPYLKSVNYAIPPNPKAVVVLFHGTGGNGHSFYTKYERLTIVKDLLYNNFAVISLSANESTIGDINNNGDIQWFAKLSKFANRNNNVDIKNVGMAIDSMLVKFGLPSNTDIYGLGMSNGAVFGDMCAAALGFKAAAHMTANGHRQTYQRSDIMPIIWIMAENDHQIHANDSTAFSHFGICQNAQASSEWHTFRKSPTYDKRFIRNNRGINLNKSKKINDSLRSKGYLDVNNYISVLDFSLISNSFYTQLNLGVKKNEVIDQIACMNANHMMHSDYNKNIIRFFNQHVTSVFEKEKIKINITVFPNPTEGKISILTPDNKINKVELLNSIGQVLISTTYNKLDLSSFKKGVYFLQIYSEKGVVSNKIIKIWEDNKHTYYLEKVKENSSTKKKIIIVNVKFAFSGRVLN